jgi:hypothetical protein
MPTRPAAQRVLSRTLPSNAIVLCIIALFCRLADRWLHASPFPEAPIETRFLHDNELQLAAVVTRPFRSIPDPPFLRALQLSETIREQDENEKKIVALVEIRNARQSLPSFLSALSALVDSIVVLDDHSDDGSRIQVIEIAAAASSVLSAPIELLLNKTGSWIREELLDRNLLLQYGRAVGGTHFVLPDYDEYFAADCVIDGTLREAILALAPGESLALPWVEAWKSSSLQRVLPEDAAMNFLVRRQTIIFADDGAVNYSLESSNARILVEGSRERSVADSAGETRQATIHVLRCPRTLCPAPLHYNGASTPLSPSASVKTLPTCRIVELRFLSLANVLLKSAWYESLGRSMGAKDSATSGKMMDFHVSGGSSRFRNPVAEVVALERLNPAWLRGYRFFDDSAYRNVEQWRVAEILKWRSNLGDGFGDGLPVYSQIALNALSKVSLRPLATHVTRLSRKGLFIVAGDPMALAVLNAFGGGVSARCAGPKGVWMGGPVATSEQNRPGVGHEGWQNLVASLVWDAVDSARGSFGFCDAQNVGTAEVTATLEMLMDELAELDIVVLVVSEKDESVLDSNSSIFPGNSKGRASLRSLALSVSGNLRYIEARRGAIRSIAGIAALQDRLFGLRRGASGAGGRTGASEWETLIEFAENVGGREDVESAPPVARLMFSLNVGRSGSRYIAGLIASTRKSGLVSLHEPGCPDNFCSGGGAVRMQETPLSTSYSQRLSKKWRMIRQSIATAVEMSAVRTRSTTFSNDLVHFVNASERSLIEINGVSGCSEHAFEDFIYSETNPNFKSWMYDVLLDTLPAHGYAVDVIVLRKYIPAVVKSLYNTGYFTERDGYNWMETTASVNAVLPSLSDRNDSGLDAYDKLISYVLNAEALSRMLMKRYASSARFVECRSEHIYSRDGALFLLAQLDISPSLKTLAVAGVPVDKYGNRNQGGGRFDTTVAECERRFADYTRRCREAGIELPQNMDHSRRWPEFKYTD